MAGLYIHIPFCRSKCAYCDFYSTPKHADADLLIDTLISEWQHRRGEIAEPVTTVYIGGGTPSVLSCSQLGRLLEALPTEGLKEFTIEANPDDVTSEWCKMIASTPVDRVSMGVQALDDVQLKAIGRRHTKRQAIDAVSLLRQVGIGNISLDLIYGLPGQTLSSWTDSLDQLLELAPKHLSAYLLSYEKGTRLWAMRQSGKVAEASEQLVTEMYGVLTDHCRAKGYVHYEVSNFAMPGYEAVHNSAYWNGTPYIGLGPGAHSWDGKCRRSYNPSDLKAYIASRGCGFAISEDENYEERVNDHIFTALRTSKGLCREAVEAKFGKEEWLRLCKIAARQSAYGNIIVSADSICIPEASWLVSDAVITEFIH